MIEIPAIASSPHARYGVLLRPLASTDASAAAELIARAMHAAEGEYAARTFEQHFASHSHGIADGRELFVLETDGRLAGVTGLHHYLWGPPQNVWLSWFAVAPELHGQGLGCRLLDETEALAKSRGFAKLFVETYSSSAFERARAFYAARGFEQVGSVRSYLPDGSDMIVFCKQLLT